MHVPSAEGKVTLFSAQFLAFVGERKPNEATSQSKIAKDFNMETGEDIVHQPLSDNAGVHRFCYQRFTNSFHLRKDFFNNRVPLCFTVRSTDIFKLGHSTLLYILEFQSGGFL